MRNFSMNAASLIESARVGAGSLRTNPTRTTLSTTGVIIGVAAQVAAFSIADGAHLYTGLLAAGSAITVGLIFGTYPARRVAELAPVNAIVRE